MTCVGPSSPAAVVRCRVEAQQPGERSSDFTAATLVSWISSHFIKEIGHKEGVRAGCVLRRESVCVRV